MEAGYDVCAHPNAKVTVAKWVPRKVLSLSRRATIVDRDRGEDEALYLHSHFPSDERIMDTYDLEHGAHMLSNHVKCLVVTHEDESVLGILTTSCVIRAFISNELDI